MKHHDLISTGRLDELNIIVQQATGASQTEVETEIDAYIQKMREVHRSGRFNMSHVDTVATVKVMNHGIVVSLLGTRSIKYTDRLLWCLLNMNKSSVKHKASGAVPTDVDLEDTQAILAMIQKSADESAADSGWNVTDNEAAGNYMSSKYVLNRLYTFDEELFTIKKEGYPHYSKMCGAVDKRQPIAVTLDALQKIRDTHNISAVSTNKGHAYICPEVWCPATETVMTMEEYKTNGSVCPSTSKPGIVLSDTKYWSGTKDRFVGFLRPDKHPTGMCMPCCFKRDPNANPTGKERLAKCGNAAPDSSNDIQASLSKKYVMGASQIPLPPDRKGDLPAGSTLSNDEFVRFGVNQSRDGFMESAAVLLGYTDSDRLREDVSKTVTVASLLATGRDGIMQRFIDYKNSPSKDAQFREHLKTSAGADQMRLSGVKLTKLASKDPLFLRELAVWDAVERFRKYVLSESVGHSLVLPFLGAMNRSTLIAVVEIIEGEEVVHMPLGGLVNSKASKVGIVMRHDGRVYEPVVMRGKGSKVAPEPLSALHPVASNILKLHRLHKEIDIKEGIGALEKMLAKQNMNAAAHVFDEKMLCVGVLLQDSSLFVPTGVPDASNTSGLKRIVYLNKLLDEPVHIASEDAKRILKSLNVTKFGDDVKNKKGETIALRVNGHYVPLRTDAPELPALFSGYDDAVHHFLKTSPAFDANMATHFRNKDALIKTYDAMMHHLRTNHITELFVLTHPLCPYLPNKRAEYLMELTSPVVSDARDIIARNAISMILSRQKRQVTNTANNAVESSDVIRANEDDVIDGTLVAVVTTASKSLEYLNLIRKVFSEATHDVQDKLRTAFGRPVAAAAVPDMQFNETKQTGVNVIYALGVAAAHAGKKGSTGVFDYVSGVVEEVISEYELRGELDRLHLNQKVVDAVREELSIARPGLDKRLRSRLTRPGVFLVGPGDAARFLSRSDVTTVVYSESAPPIVEGSGSRAIVAFVSKEGNVALALTRTDDGNTTCMHDFNGLPKVIRTVIDGRVT